MTPRLWAAVAFGVLLLAALVTAAVAVPWSRPPAPRADQLAALKELPPERVARGRALHAELRPATYGSLALGLGVAVVLGFTTLGAQLVAQVARPFGGHWVASAVLGGLAVVLLAELVVLPLSAWRHSIAVRYGLSTQTWGGWAVDVAKAYAVSAVIAAVALLGFYAVARWSPRWWWAFGAAGAAALVTLLSFVLPVVVEPIFNKFTPMPAGPLRTELIALADRDGVPVRDVLVADASRRTRMVNAYVSGLGPTRRIVVYDTLLGEAPPGEIVSVVAHELGHAKRGDVAIGTALAALGAATAVCGLFLLGSWTGLLRRAGVESLTDPRSIALLVAVVTLVGVVTTPAQNLVSRRVEARADGHALALTGDPATFEAMEQRLALVNLADVDPNPVEHALFATHPSTVERIAAARAYARGER